jgi:hypothetical protein
MSSSVSPHDDYYNYTPLPAWQRAVGHYGKLVEQREWKRLYPLFDFVKQLSTSCLSVSFHPTIVENVLYLSREPLGNNPQDQPRVRIDMVDPDQVRVELFAADASGGDAVSFYRVDALHMLNSLLEKL